MWRKQSDQNTNLLEKAKTILKERNYTKDCYPLYELINTVVLTEKNVNRKVFWYKWSGFILLVSVPLISTLISVIISQETKVAGSGPVNIFIALLPIAPYLSLGLTLMTILNSIFKPSERFRTACFMSIKISHFKSDILAEIEKLSSPIDNIALLKMVHLKRIDFELYQEQLVGLFMPEAIRN